MLALVRIHVPLAVHDPRTRITKHIVDRVWDYVVENHEEWHTDDVKPLYMTRRYLEEDTSLIVDAKDADVLAEFLMDKIAPIENVRGIWVINMARMKLFITPKEHHHDLSRFTVTIDAMPQHADEIYETVSALKPGRDVVIVYVAHTFQSLTASLMVSALARSADHMNAFVDDYIKPLEGVVETETTYISKTLRLATPKEWKESLGPYFVYPGGESIRGIDVEDYSLMAGC